MSTPLGTVHRDEGGRCAHSTTFGPRRVGVQADVFSHPVFATADSIMPESAARTMNSGG